MDDNIIADTFLIDEEKAYEMMIFKYTPYVNTIVYNMCAPSLTCHDMEEIVADVFFKMWKNKDILKKDYFKGILIKTTQNTCIDALKKRKYLSVQLNDDTLQNTNDNNLCSVIEQNDQMIIISKTVQNFKQPDKEIFTRFYYFGEKLNTISTLMNINISTVKTKLRLCKKKLKKALIKEGYNHEL